MSKNSTKQNLECFQNWLQVVESRRKRKQNTTSTQRSPLVKYHPSLKYDGE